MNLKGLFAVVLVVLGLLSVVLGQGNVEVIQVDIAENGSRFSPDETPVFEDDKMPAYGNPFITQGYIYPAGTLSAEHDGVNADGSPEFPDQVLGEWTCYGYHVGDGAHTQTGPSVVTTQIYNFGDTPGAKTLITNGYELADQNVQVARAITGGSGEYGSANGEMTQEFLGWNESKGVNLRVELSVQRNMDASQ